MMQLHWKRRALCLLALLSMSLGACSQEPQYTGDPAGVDRNAKPRMIITKDAGQLDDMPLRPDVTKTAEINAFLGYAREEKNPFTDPFFNRTGINFLVKSETDTGERPGVLHEFDVWVGQKGSNKFRPCTQEEWKPYLVWVSKYLETIRHEGNTEEDMQRHEKYFRSKCNTELPYPATPFKGYLEVDGLPIGPRMSLVEVQARRKQLGLAPLVQHPLDSSGTQFMAYRTEYVTRGWYQTWTFSWPTDDKKDTRVLLSVSVP